MSLTTDSAALLRAICADPYDLLARLAYADLCEEAGDDARAEFIRCQVELPRLEAEKESSRNQYPYPRLGEFRIMDGDFETLPRYTHLCERIDYLRRRERELFERYGTDWLSDFYGHWSGVSANLCRGLIERVRLPLATWVGRACDCDHGIRPPAGAGEPWTPCPACHGTGRTEAYGPALVLACPLLRVDLSDREPNGPYGSGDPLWLWYEAIDPPGHEDIPAALPSVLWSLLPQDYYPDEQSATDALSAACLAWARQQAGLPPLKVK